MLANDQLSAWDREAFFHPSTHLAAHARGDSAVRVITGGSGARARFSVASSRKS